MMKPLTIATGNSLSTPGDFAATVDEAGSRLLVPQDLSDKLTAQGIRTASELVSYLLSFPTAAAKDLNWSIEDVSRGLDQLKDQLRGHVDDFILDPPEHPKRGYGGLNAADLKRRG
jgi:hypothetical protein